MTSISDPYRAKAYVLDRETAPAFWLVATLWLPMAVGYQTANRFAFLEQVMPSGLGPPTHRHPFADEGFFVLEGTCSFNCEGETYSAGPGSFVHLPRMTPHSFSVDTNEARVVNFYAPAGFEMIVLSCANLALERRRPSIEEAPPPPPAAVEQLRILSRLFGQEEVHALPFSQPSTDALMATARSASSPFGKPHVTTVAEARNYAAFGSQWRLLGSSDNTIGTYDLFHVEVPGGTGLAPRILPSDEAIYVLEGVLDLNLDGVAHDIGVGSFSYLPSGTIASWRASEAGAKLLVFHLPGGFDRAIVQAAGSHGVAEDNDRVQAMLEAAGARFLPVTA